MTACLFRVALQDGTVRLARGDSGSGPRELLDAALTLDGILAAGGRALGETLSSAPTAGDATALAILPPVESQEVWGAGVTYERSKAARMEESASPSVYDHVYDAERPELFLKASGWRVRGPGQTIGIRADSTWDVPEPELALVFAADGALAGFTIGNDVSSRTIEGENPLYLPQAKIYESSCALGPGIVPVDAATPPFAIDLEVIRDGAAVFRGATSSGRLHRSFGELGRYLFRALDFPAGAFLLTGTGIIPEPDFSLRAGDRVRISVEGLGVLENPVVTVGSR